MLFLCAPPLFCLICSFGFCFLLEVLHPLKWDEVGLLFCIFGGCLRLSSSQILVSLDGWHILALCRLLLRPAIFLLVLFVGRKESLFFFFGHIWWFDTNSAVSLILQCGACFLSLTRCLLPVWSVCRVPGPWSASSCF